jgi:hypothetical protein
MNDCGMSFVDSSSECRRNLVSSRSYGTEINSHLKPERAGGDSAGYLKIRAGLSRNRATLANSGGIE